jgi:hypothetical protein
VSEHARDRFDLVPDAAAEVAFLDAFGKDRLHHAWLLCGPEGSGKATFAFRAARRLLGAAPDPSRGPLGTSPDDPVARLVTARSHPDLLVLERAVEGGKTKKSISVDQARELPEFFSKSPSQARYRVAIIDAADDLNLNAANALLKVLEEPPERGVLFPRHPCAGAAAGDDPLALPPTGLPGLAAACAGGTGAQPHGRKLRRGGPHRGHGGRVAWPGAGAGLGRDA